MKDNVKIKLLLCMASDELSLDTNACLEPEEEKELKNELQLLIELEDNSATQDCFLYHKKLRKRETPFTYFFDMLDKDLDNEVGTVSSIRC